MSNWFEDGLSGADAVSNETAHDEQAARQRGHADGGRWAQRRAKRCELKNLAKHWPAAETTETDDAYGAPGVFLRMISGEHALMRQEIDDFWMNLGNSSHDGDAYSPDYWDGFADGALEVFDQLD